jgi:drug/metabolite transporter, DME family
VVTGQRRYLAAVLLAAVLWGTTGTVAQQAPAGSSHALVGVSTFGFGGLLLLVVDRQAAARVFRDPVARRLVVAGVVGVVGYAAMFYLSMDLVGVAVGNVLALGSGPVFAALLELLVEGRRVRAAWAVATGVTLAGVALLASAAGAAPGTNPVLGVLLGLGAGFGYALYSWSAVRVIGRGRHGSRGVMAAIFGGAAVLLVPVFVLAGPGPLLTGTGPLVLAYLAVVPMAVAYLAFGYGLRRLTASTATTLALAEPLVATGLAVVVLGERLGLASWLGVALIIVGLALVAVAERRPTPVG